jgi:GAF domain-containing protein
MPLRMAQPVQRTLEGAAVTPKITLPTRGESEEDVGGWQRRGERARAAITRADRVRVRRSCADARLDAGALTAGLQDLIATMMTSGFTLLNADRISIFLVDEPRQEFWLAASEDGVNIRIPLTSGVCGECYRTKKVLNVQNCQASPWFNKSVDDMTAYVTRSLICAPILDSINGSTVVAIAEALNKVDPKTGDIIPFSEGDCDTLMTLGSELGIALRHKMLDVCYERILHQAATEDDKALRSLLELYSTDRRDDTPAWSASSKTLDVERMQKQGYSMSAPNLSIRPLKKAGPEDGKKAQERDEGSQALLMRSRSLKRAQEGTGSMASSLTWDFDIFNASDSQLLLYVCDVYKERGLMQTFNIDDATLVNFVTAVQKRYHNHPFHNFRHGFSVMQTTYLLLRFSCPLLLAPYPALARTSRPVVQALLGRTLCRCNMHVCMYACMHACMFI